MEQIGNDIFTFGLGAAAIGALVAAFIQLLKREYDWQGRFVKHLTLYSSLIVGMLILLLTSDISSETAVIFTLDWWRTALFIILRGITAGAMIALAAFGVHNWFRPTGKADAAARQPLEGSPIGEEGAEG